MHDATNGPFRHLEGAGNGTVADAGREQLPELADVGDHPRASEPLALGAGSAESGMRPLDDPRPFDSAVRGARK
jgi:hypothetical protein